MASGSQNMTSHQANKWTNLRAFTIGSAENNVDGTRDLIWSTDEILGGSGTDKFLRADKEWTNILTGNLTINGTIYFGAGTSSGKAILSYNSTYPNYGIWYFDDTVDTMTFSASGNANDAATADFSINGLGTGTLTNRGNRIPHTGNTTGTVGGTEQPVYVNAGTITSTSYALKATINNGTATYLAYYSGARAVSSHGLAHFSDTYSSSTANGKNELVLGNATGKATNGSAWGQLALYSEGTKGTYLKSAENSTAWYTLTMPAKTGTICLTDGTGASGTWGISITGTSNDAKYLYDWNYGSGSGDTAVNALKSFFDAGPTRSRATACRLKVGSNYMAFGYFLAGDSYNTTAKAYGGWFVAEYGAPHYIGISNGTWTDNTLAHNNNVGTGDNNGQVKIAGTNVSVKGLGTAAYTASTDYATSGHNHDSTYLKLSGGTMTGDITMTAGKFIKRAGVSQSWINGRDKAIIKTTSYSGYDAITSMKTTNGSWEMGVYTGNILYFTYAPDSNYSASPQNNSGYVQVSFTAAGNVRASKFNGLTLTAATTGFTIAGGSTTLKTLTVNESISLNAGAASKLAWYSTANTISGARNAYLIDESGDSVANKRNELVLGNATAKATNGSSFGRLALYSEGTKGTYLVSAENSTAWYTLTMPAKTGTICLTDGTGASGTWDISITGNAATATKLGTATVGGSNRPIYLNAGTATAVSWYHNSCSITGGNNANYPWHRFAYCTTGTGSYTDKSVIVILHSRFDGGQYGMVKLSIRTNAASAAKSTSAVWIYRKGFAVDDIKISAPTKTTGTDETISAYIKCSTYPRRIAYILEGSNVGWNLVSSNEPNDTTTSDKKGGTEINASVSGNNATDGATVSYANSAGSCSGNAATATNVAWTGITSNPGIYANDVTSYGNIKVTTAKGSYYGINLGGNASGMSIMSINASHQGLYNQTNGQWILYYNAASNSKSIVLGNSTVNVTGGISLNLNTKVTGTLTVTSTITGNLTGNVTGNCSGSSGSCTGNALTCSYPAGFVSRSTGTTWGNTTGTCLTTWNTTNGGSIDFRYDNPSSGKLSIKVDGRFYGNEGTYPTMLMNYTNNYWGMGDPDAGTSVWIRTTSNGIIPYQSGAKGSGHCGIGTSSWYFSTAYIDTITSNKTYGAVWNDIAECRRTTTKEPGRVVVENKSGIMELSSIRMQATGRIISDTYGYCMGEPANDGTPIAIAGRVLVYPYRKTEEYNLGDCVCTAPNGTVDIMTREEIKEYPDRIIGIVSEIPTYEIWSGGAQNGNDDIEVKGRIWIYVR